MTQEQAAAKPAGKTAGKTAAKPGRVVIAGGSGGIGAAICRTLAAAGHDVFLTCHRNRPQAEAVAAELRGMGRRAAIAAVDLDDAAAVGETLARADEFLGGIDTAIYAAGPYIDMRHVSRLEPDLFRRTAGLDLFGCYNFLQASLPALRVRGGAIVALATPAIRRPVPRDLLSSAPKAAIEAVVRCIALEEGRFGIRANCVGVGVIGDGMFHRLRASGDMDDKFVAATCAVLPLRRLGTAQEIADAVEFLASSRAAYITGQTLMVDGGHAMG